MTRNPFPGAKPYRASDRARFFGRDDLSHLLSEGILASRCVAVFGPRGAGKTSLLSAAVFPWLLESQDARVVSVAEWPAREEPTRALLHAMHRDLRLNERREPGSLHAGVVEAARRGARASSRLTVVCLDHIEQILSVERAGHGVDELFDCIGDISRHMARSMRVVVCVREDFLGRFLDRFRGQSRVLEQYFRIPSLTVAEMASVACQTAAAGDPPQRWSPDELRAELLSMREPDQPAIDAADVRSSYVQLYCRALFEERASGGARSPSKTAELRSYVDRTVAEVPLEELLREENENRARALLSDPGAGDLDHASTTEPERVK